MTTMMTMMMMVMTTTTILLLRRVLRLPPHTSRPMTASTTRPSSSDNSLHDAGVCRIGIAVRTTTTTTERAFHDKAWTVRVEGRASR